MKQALALFAAVTLLSVAGDVLSDDPNIYPIAIGAISLMSAMIGATFLWLWYERTTPLALGMAFSWAGMACVLGWAWMFSLWEHTGLLPQRHILLIFLALHWTGAVLHFGVIQRSIGAARWVFGAPIAAALGVSLLVSLLH